MRIMPFMKRKKGIQFAGVGLDSGGGGGTLPIASADTLGAVKVGENLNITSEGVLSASGGGVSFADAEHEVGTYGNRKLFSRTFIGAVPSSVSSADAWITASSPTSFDNIIAYFGNFIDGNHINVAVTRADYEASNGDWHVTGMGSYSIPSNGRVYLTIFYTKTGL